MFYVRTTGGSMMAITPKSTSVVAVKKEPGMVKNLVGKKKSAPKKN